MSIPINEQETTINFSRDEQGLELWTNDSTVITKMDKLCEKAPNYYKLVSVSKIDGEIVDKAYEVSDKTLLSFRSGKIILSEEQKQQRAERMKKMRNSQ